MRKTSLRILVRGIIALGIVFALAGQVSADVFTTYPVINSVSPLSGDWVSGQRVTIQGSGFSDNSQGRGRVMLACSRTYIYCQGVIGLLSIISWSDTVVVADVPSKIGGEGGGAPSQDVAHALWLEKDSGA